MEPTRRESALKVQSGVDQPASINPNRRPPRRKPNDPARILEGLLSGDRSSLARAITLVESRKPQHEAVGATIVEACLPRSGRSIRVGITGVPGVGKSTFIEALGRTLTASGRRVAVLAVDPSSAVGGGSILGDKSRMPRLAADPHAFIRPSPSAGSLGGVTRRTREAIILCETAGYDVVLVETVGVGQSELAVHSMTDSFLLLMLAGAGDELQGIKRGIVEMADVIAVSKADGTNLDRASLARRQIQNALWLYPPSPTGWRPEVVLASALTGEGMGEVWASVEGFLAHEQEVGEFEQRRARQRARWFDEALEGAVLDDFFRRPGTREGIESLRSRVVAGEITPRSAVDVLLRS